MKIVKLALIILPLILGCTSEAEKEIYNLIFLDNKDGELSPNTNTIERLIKIIDNIVPDAIFLPFFMDNHPDHKATNSIFKKAIRAIPPCMCYAWGIWSPLPLYNLCIDITPYIDIKLKAIEEHRSQCEEFDITGAFAGLAKYYGVISGIRHGRGYAEVFLVCSSDEYLRLMGIMEC